MAERRRAVKRYRNFSLRYWWSGPSRAFPAKSDLFGAYGIGLAEGFFLYFIVLVIVVATRGTFEIWRAGQFAQNGTLVIYLEDEDRTTTEGLVFEVFIASLTNPEQKSITSTSGYVYSLLPGK
ncbi:MAG: hypothetical protein ACREA9_24720 [Pyrinomonadaceae bacterium]